jgi:hypothetical protein
MAISLKGAGTPHHGAADWLELVFARRCASHSAKTVVQSLELLHDFSTLDFSARPVVFCGESI